MPVNEEIIFQQYLWLFKTLLKILGKKKWQ
jgi:hypothetical protein